MAKPKGGLTAWFGKGPKGDWVDIGAPKKKGKFQACGRKSAKGSKRKYPKCVPRSKAKSMTAAQRKSAVERKRAAKSHVHQTFKESWKARCSRAMVKLYTFHMFNKKVRVIYGMKTRTRQPTSY